MNPFVIVGLSRTGSTMLVNSLNRIPNVTCFGEIAVLRDGKPKPPHPQETLELQRQIKTTSSFRTWVVNEFKLPNDKYDVSDIFDNGKDISLSLIKWLQWIFHKDRTVGFKLLFPHIQETIQLVGILKMLNVNFIHLYRNPQKRVQSLINKGHIPEKRRKEYERLSVMQDNTIEYWFPNSLKISYEDITNDKEIKEIPSDVAGKITDFLGLPETKIPVKTRKEVYNG